jgi:hypothetical protein
VPVHPELIRIGFLAFVARLRSAGHVRRLPEWCERGEPEKGPAARDIFSRAFGNFRRSVGFAGVYDDLHAT